MSLTIIGASAGTGKTERLSGEVADAITGKDQPPVDVEGLVAVTYTKKAEAELRARIRMTLAKRNRFDEAQRLPLAYIGTVHGVCKRLLEEFALLTGLSPQVDVLPESAADRAATEALEAALTDDEHAELDTICRRMRPNYDARFVRHKWVPDAQDLIELARSNQIAPAQIPQMATRSFELLQPLLGPRRKDGAAIEDALKKAIRKALACLGDGSDTKVTATAIEQLRGFEQSLDLGDGLPWASWLKLSSLQAAARFRDVMAEVNDAAAAHRAHPRFHDDLAGYLRLVYTAVARGLQEYARWKAERRYIDYTDMEERALALLRRDEVRAELGARLQILVVDEFQDTSPIQLALFLELEKLCKRTVWVGDRKQSIFAFRGADPMLMDAVVKDVEKRGGKQDFLQVNYRSRPSLVDFCSDLFTQAFRPHGYVDKEVQARAHRPEVAAQQQKLPPLGVFHVTGKNAEHDADGIAEGVRRLLASPAETPVVDRASGEVRDLRAGDVAILTATNKDALAIATALGRRGIEVALPRRRLLETPEGTFLHAALRLVADAYDTVAWSRLDALDGFAGLDPDAWLGDLLQRRAQKTDLLARGPVARLLPERERLLHLAPSEALDELIGMLELPRRAMAWPRPEERLHNLEAFRALAAEYENEVESAREPGSIVGFLHFLDEATGSGVDDTGQDRKDAQHSGGADAVQICTYHRSKGLEWPVVILASLNVRSRAFGIPPDAAAMRLQRGGRSQHFSATPESDSKTFDPQDPLAGRWLRFWPWPYGEQKSGELLDQVANTTHSRNLLDAEMRESLRLLYVGFTRARDHLVFAVRSDRPDPQAKKASAKKKDAAPYKAEWLHTINDGTPGSLLELPTGEQPVQAGKLLRGATKGRDEIPARVFWIDGTALPTTLPRQVTRQWFTSAPPVARPSYLIAPSRAATDWPEVVPKEPPQITLHKLGERIPLHAGDHEMNAIGDAIHAVFAADRFDLAREERVARALKILRARSMTDVVRADHLVERHDALRAWLEERYPGATWHREYPVVGAVKTAEGVRQVRGAIDLLVATCDSAASVDHKAYPGADLQGHAVEHASQLGAYRALLGQVGHDASAIVHFSTCSVGAEVAHRPHQFGSDKMGDPA